MVRAVDERLVKAAPSSTEALLELLFDGLDWPKPDRLEIADVPLIDFRPEDLHLRAEVLARLDSVQQLPPLVAAQPFGVFILRFSGGRLPVGAVRRVVNALVRKKRAGGRSTGGVWDLEDLLFFCQADSGGGTMHVANFKESDGLPVLRVISWDAQSTSARIDLVARDYLTGLAWPEPGTQPEVWRERWSSAFSVSYREGVRSAATLADRMADVARGVRSEILALHEVETEYGPINALFADIKRSLTMGLTLDEFADMYAQTMVYGLLTARISHPEHFRPGAPASKLTFDNAFLDALYTGFRRAGDEVLDADEFGLQDLAELLSRTNVDEILADFGATDVKDDPVVFFYEEFLERYDPDQRKALGAYYTPVPIVRAMVAAVDELLKSEFDLPLGIADPMCWQEFADLHEIAIPTGLGPSDRVVRMLDPATGTGTFLLEWLRRAKQNLSGATDPDGERLRSVVESVEAFEVSLSAYAVAHLKTRMELDPALRSNVELGIRLSNTLVSDVAPSGGLLEEDPIARESTLADRTKKDTGHLVVLGNPPYKDRSKGLGPSVEKPRPGRSEPLLADFTPAPERGLGAHTKILRNLYVFFWRWALDKALGTPPTKPGVVAFITSSAWLTGPVFETMREYIRDGHHVWVIDLGGDIKIGVENDENVFPGVQIATAICIVARTPRPGDGRIRYRRLLGTREEKFSALARLSIHDDSWTVLESRPDEPIGHAKSSEWSRFVPLGELMPFHANGVHQQRTWVNDPNPDILRERWSRLVAADRTDRPVLMKETRSRKVSAAGRDLDSGAQLPPLDGPLDASPASIVRYSFRTLDRQWLLADSRVIDMPSPELWSVRSDRQVFLNELHSHPIGAGPSISIAGQIPNLHHFHGRGGRVIPVFRDGESSEFNLLPGLLDLVNARSAEPVAPEEIIAYVIGIAAFPGLQKAFGSDLGQGGVRIPLCLDPLLIHEVGELGTRAVELFTYGERALGQPDGTFAVRQDGGPRLVGVVPDPFPMPERMNYDETAQVLRAGDITIERVRPEVWSYEVSGMQVVKKWFGYRKASPAAKRSSPLNDIVSTTWPAEWTEDLLDLLHVIAQLRALEERHEELLERVRAAPLLDHSEIRANGLVPPPVEATKPSRAGTLD